MRSLLTILLLLFMSLVIDAAIKDKVLLKDVQTLTLIKGQKTTGRRSSPVPQIQFVGGSARGQFDPRTVQCYNRGHDGNDVQWECKAEMDEQFEFGRISVSCEGYDYPDDPYVLKGSCGLEYELEYTNGGGKSAKKGAGRSTKSTVDTGDEGSPLITKLMFGAFILFVLYVFFYKPGADQQPGDGSRPRGGGGGGGYPGAPPYPPGDDAPPPPYDESMGHKGAYPNLGSTTFGFGRPQPHQQGGNQGQDGLGGFWTGAALGSLGGYFMGNRNATPGDDNVRQRNSGQRTRFDEDTGFSSSNADRPSTSTTRETSGFGGTTRR